MPEYLIQVYKTKDNPTSNLPLDLGEVFKKHGFLYIGALDSRGKVSAENVFHGYGLSGSVAHDTMLDGEESELVLRIMSENPPTELQSKKIAELLKEKEMFLFERLGKKEKSIIC